MFVLLSKLSVATITRAQHVCRPGAEALIKEVYFKNLACINLMGKAPPVKDYTALINAMPERERSNQRAWTDVIKKVHSTHLKLHRSC